MTPSFTPDRAGSYTVQLIVTDNNSAASLAGDDDALHDEPRTDGGDHGEYGDGVGGCCVHDALRQHVVSDPDGDALTYAWSFTSRPAGSTAAFTGGTTVNPTFTPDRAGSYTVQLIVTDNNSAASFAGDVDALHDEPRTDGGDHGEYGDGVGGCCVHDALRAARQAIRTGTP